MASAARSIEVLSRSRSEGPARQQGDDRERHLVGPDDQRPPGALERRERQERHDGQGERDQGHVERLGQMGDHGPEQVVLEHLEVPGAAKGRAEPLDRPGHREGGAKEPEHRQRPDQRVVHHGRVPETGLVQARPAGDEEGGALGVTGPFPLPQEGQAARHQACRTAGAELEQQRRQAARLGVGPPPRPLGPLRRLDPLAGVLDAALLGPDAPEPGHRPEHHHQEHDQDRQDHQPDPGRRLLKPAADAEGDVPQQAKQRQPGGDHHGQRQVENGTLLVPGHCCPSSVPKAACIDASAAWRMEARSSHISRLWWGPVSRGG